jgi:hypothetical protein
MECSYLVNEFLVCMDMSILSSIDDLEKLYRIASAVLCKFIKADRLLL